MINIMNNPHNGNNIVTIADLADQFSDFASEGITNNLALVYEESSPSTWKVERMYQRMVSPNTIKRMGVYDPSLSVPPVVSERPKSFGDLSGMFVIDGQQHSIKHVQSKTDSPMMAAILKHPEDATYEQVLKKEAEVFFKLNTNAKALSKLEKVRSGVVYDDPESIRTYEAMKALNLKCDNFGSESDDALEIKNFSQFDHMVNKEHYHDSMGVVHFSDLQQALWLLKKVYPEDREVNALVLRAFVLVNSLDKLSNNGRKDNWTRFITDPNGLRRDFPKQRLLHQGMGTYGADKDIFWERIFRSYRIWTQSEGLNNNFIISKDTMENFSFHNKKFTAPEGYIWKV
jgi:hypothetical protein